MVTIVRARACAPLSHADHPRYPPRLRLESRALWTVCTDYKIRNTLQLNTQT